LISKRNFIKDESAPEDIGNIQKPKGCKNKETKKDKRNEKNTHKDPTTAENPKHPNKNPKTLYNITSQQPSYFCPK
jgi:hypothetical protein